MNDDDLARRAGTALNRLAKWRAVFAAWQLGTRAAHDPECRAVRDHREVTMLLRAEVNALTGLLIDKGVFSAAEFTARLLDEAEHLSRSYEGKFPGMRATDDGIVYDMPRAGETMRGWLP